jgi:hypothetical protein
MKRIIGVMLLASVRITAVQACDVCGCSASNQYLGILPKANLNFIGFQYQYNSFTSDHPSLFEHQPNEHGKDYYNTFQLWGRYNVGKRLQLFAFLPYRYNVQLLDTSRTTSPGLGDVSMLANAMIIKEDATSEGWQQLLLAGGGIKFPTGKYTGITTMDKQGLPNMQPGTGSWDFIVNTNYTVRRKSAGVNVDVAYTITMPNAEKYKYGNRLNAGVLGFYRLKRKGATILPQAGLRYEYTLNDYDNYDRKWLNEQSGGYMCFATAGLQAYVGQFGLRLTYQLPVSQHYGAGYITAWQKVDAGVFFLF